MARIGRNSNGNRNNAYGSIAMAAIGKSGREKRHEDKSAMKTNQQ
jgi:hypothetical protein